VTKIVVCVRARDEEHRIGQFCESYKDADLILVADGGSVDNTINIAESYLNTLVIRFRGRTHLKKGHWRNNDSDHANFLFKYAYEKLNPDWIIFDDCDIRPNYLLRRYYRSILEQTDKDVVLAVRVYLWGTEQYFPQLSSPLGEEFGQGSLWAWRGNLDLWTVDVPPAFTFRIGNKDVKDFREDAKTEEILFPFCLLHYSWDDPDRVEKKIKYYRESGFIPNMQHPLNFGGYLYDLEDWMCE
jgi:glycosyltransferase involved in cell wall biosynthesis